MIRVRSLTADPVGCVQRTTATLGLLLAGTSPGATAGLPSSARLSGAANAGALRTPYKRRGFTLIEVLVVITIIGIVASMGLGALFQAQEVARRSRTKGLIARLHTQISSRWDSYRTRRLPIDFYTASSVAGRPGTYFDPNNFQASATTTRGMPSPLSGVTGLKLAALRELMRMELPDRYSDLVFLPNRNLWTNTQSAQLTSAGGSAATAALLGNSSGWTDPVYNQPLPTFPALRIAYLRRIQAIEPTNPNIVDIIYSPNNTTGRPALADQFQSAECLYLVMTTGFTDENSDGQTWHTRDVADTDKDGMPEFIDGWGTPIEWIRWPAGYFSDLQPASLPTGDHDPSISPDPFDIRGIDRVPPTGASNPPPRGYSIFPLIVSAGRDGSGRNDARGSFGLYFLLKPRSGLSDEYSDPYLPYLDSTGTQSFQRGTVIPNSELSNDPYYAGGSADDNITNHQIDAKQ